MYDNVEFGGFIRARREEKHFSLEKLAELCDISDRCISNIERGRSDPKFSTVMAICDVCGVNVGQLSQFSGNSANYEV